MTSVKNSFSWKVIAIFSILQGNYEIASSANTNKLVQL